MRTLLPEYDRAARHVVPGSQSGFTKGMNAPAQTLAVRMQMEQCMTERTMCVRGYIDLGTYFMSIVNDVVGGREVGGRACRRDVSLKGPAGRSREQQSAGTRGEV